MIPAIVTFIILVITDKVMEKATARREKQLFVRMCKKEKPAQPKPSGEKITSSVS